MSTTDVISPDLKTVLRRLKLSPILDTLPERLALARQQTACQSAPRSVPGEALA